MHSIKAKLIAILFVSLAFAYVLHFMHARVALVGYMYIRAEGIDKIVKLEAEKVNKIIAELERAAIHLATEGLLFYESKSYGVGETAVLEYVRSFPLATGCGLWFEPYAYKSDARNIGVYAFFDEKIGKARLDSIESEYDYHELNWYKEISGSLEKPYHAAWTKPYIDDSSYRLMTTAGAGIYDRDGKLIGISIVDWGIEEVVNKLGAVKPTENSFVLLRDKKGNAIANTRAGGEASAAHGGIKYESAKELLRYIRHKKPSVGMEYISFEENMDNGWALSVKVPSNEIFAEAEGNKKTFALIVLIVATINIFFAYFLVSKYINTPIKRLISEVSKVSINNLTRIEMKSKDELGQLAIAFNKKAAELQRAIEASTRERTEKERIVAELNVASGIQASMLPYIFPPFPHRREFDIYALMFPAKEVGGDFYDFFFVDENTLAIVIADVSGKGIPSALFMVIAQTLIKNNACSGKSPKDVFETVNSILCENNDTLMFVTAFMGYYNVASGKLTYVNAGHNPPLVRKGAGAYEFLNVTPHFFLAWNKDTKYAEEEIALKPGDAIYLYTDGVTEAMNKNSDLFSEQRLLAALNEYKDKSPKELLHAIKWEISFFEGGEEQADDITMLALKINRENIKKLELDACVENLGAVLDFVNAELKVCNLSSESQNDIELAVEEIFVNIANYAYEPAKGSAAVYVSYEEPKITIKFEDSGKPYNPLEQDEPSLDKPLMEREIGGLGIFFVKKLMDSVEYARIQNKNVLTIAKLAKSSPDRVLEFLSDYAFR